MRCYPENICPSCGEANAAPDLTDFYAANWYGTEVRGTCRECKSPWIWLDTWAGWECVWPMRHTNVEVVRE